MNYTIEKASFDILRNRCSMQGARSETAELEYESFQFSERKSKWIHLDLSFCSMCHKKGCVCLHTSASTSAEVALVQCGTSWNYVIFTLRSEPYVLRYDKTYIFPCFFNVSELGTILYKVMG
jgi:hypothetical protein